MLYSADILGSAIPIGTTKKTKKAKTVAETDDVAPVVKPKKVLSDEQKEKMKEGRERKKKEASDAANAAIEAVRVQEESKLDEEKIKADKKAAAAAKRKATLLAKKSGAVPEVEASAEEAPVIKTKQKRKKPVDPEVAIEAALDEAFAESAPGVPAEPPVKKSRKKKEVDPNEPPAWFTNVFKTVLTEKSTVSGDNKPKKQIIEESKSSAQEQWKSGIVRDRVNNETNGHMARLTTMIFGDRQM